MVFFFCLTIPRILLHCKLPPLSCYKIVENRSGLLTLLFAPLGSLKKCTVLFKGPEGGWSYSGEHMIWHGQGDQMQ